MMNVEYYRGEGRSGDRDRPRSHQEKYRGRNGHYNGEGYGYHYGHKGDTPMNGRVINNNNKKNESKSEGTRDDDDSASKLSTVSQHSDKKRKSFRRLISRFAEKTSMVGVPYINNAKFWWAKLIWSIMLLLAIAVMTLHLWYLIDQYFNYPIQTKVSLGFSALDFPQVTVCNVNHMKMGALQQYYSAEEIKELVNQMKPENLVPDQYDSNYDPYATKPPEVPPTGAGNKPPDGNGGGTQPPSGDGGAAKPPGGNTGGTQPPGGGGGITQPPGGDGGAAKPPGGNTGATQPPGGGGGITQQPGGGGGDTKPPGGNAGATQPPGGGGGITQQPGGGGGDTKPPKRRKRFVENYNNFNISKYRPKDRGDPRDIEPTGNEKVYDGEKDAQTELLDLFEELYMDIPKHDRSVLGHNISDMLISCTFNGRECTNTMFTLHQTSDYGNCWSLSSEKFRVLKSGPSSGLTLILYLETTEYLKGITNGYGARIQVHERGTYPFPADDGLYIPASMETAIGLKQVTVNRKGEPFGSCDDGVEFQRLHENKYTRRACQVFCEATTVINRCQCFDDKSEGISRQPNDTLRPCRSLPEVKCMLRVYKEGLTDSDTCLCDNPCSEVTYARSVSQRQWPSDDYAMVLLEDICAKHKEVCKNMRDDMDMTSIRNNFLKLTVYFEDLNYEAITEDAEIEVQQFLSDVGGAIGLWIGLSILSLCEVVQLFVELCDYGVHKTIKDRRRERKKRRKERNKRLADERQTNSDSWPRTDFGKDSEGYPNSSQTSSHGRQLYPSHRDLQYGSRY